MGHQELHLVRQNTAIAQNKVFPEARHIGCEQQGHAGLLGSAAAFAVIAGATGRYHVHPVVYAILGKRNNVFTGKVCLMETATTISTNIAVTRKQFGIGEAGTQVKGIDIGNAPRADDAVYANNGLQARVRIVTTAKHGNLGTSLPTHLARGVMNNRLFQRYPGLGQSLTRQLQDFHK